MRDVKVGDLEDTDTVVALAQAVEQTLIAIEI